MRRIISKYQNTKDSVIQWQTKAGNIKTNRKVKVDLCVPFFSTTQIVVWEFHVDNSSEII